MISFQEENKVFHIKTRNTSYLFQAEGYLKNLYWGATIDPQDANMLLDGGFHSSFDLDTNREREEYPCWNGRSYTEPCINLQRGQVRYLFPEYCGWKVTSHGDGSETLDILLEDRDAGVVLILHYRVYEEFDIIARSVTLTNNDEEEELRLINIRSACASLPHAGQQYQMRYVTGKWAGEWQINHHLIQTGVMTLQSKRGITGPHFNPTFAVGEADSTEEQGRVYFGALGYSGNWKITVEQTIFKNVQISAGINDFDFSYSLAAGESFTTPALYLGFTRGGYGEMSRILHRFQNEYILTSPKLRRVLYNSWEATAFDVKVAEQKKLAKKSAEMGVELFVVDDGWFGQRHSDRSGLGDWTVNPNKFPAGLGELISYVNSLKMDFGIWVEPESVNPDSDLYRSHPDWIYHYREVEPLQGRNQYVLNITLPQVQQYLKKMLADLLTHNNITFLKWDMNRAISDLGTGGDKNQQQLWYQHVQALYGLWEYLKQNFPHVELETCAGGGGRVDMGILARADQCWPSDNTDPFDRLFIQEGFTQFYSPKAMMCWVTDDCHQSGKATRSIRYRFHSAMCGGLGIGANINKLPPQQMEEYAEYIAQYKALRHIIQFGRLYRLLLPGKSPISAVQYLSQSGKEAVVIAFLHSQKFGDSCSRIRLQGLEPNARYAVEGLATSYAGSTLMEVGLPVALKGDFDSQLVHLQKQQS